MTPEETAILIAKVDELLSRPVIQPEGLRAEQAAAFVGVKRSQWDSLVAGGRAPQPVNLGSRCPVWSASELRAWLAAGAPALVRWINSGEWKAYRRAVGAA